MTSQSSLPPVDEDEEMDDGPANGADTNAATVGSAAAAAAAEDPNATDDDEESTSNYSRTTHSTPRGKGKASVRRRLLDEPGASLAAAASAAASAASSVAAIAIQAHVVAQSRSTPGGSGTKRRRAAATSSAESSPIKADKSETDATSDLLLTPSKRGKTQKLKAPGSANSAVSIASSDGEDDGRGGDKGLRLFANKVCEVMQRLQVSTYKHVADELVDALKGVSAFAPGSGSSLTSRRSVVGSDYQEQNIRRRVYDALNVLESVGAITKDYKDIRWIGLPKQLNESITAVMIRKQECANRIWAKRAALVELLTQQVSLHTLIERNSAVERQLMQQQLIFDDHAKLQSQQAQPSDPNAAASGRTAAMDTASTAAAAASSSAAAFTTAASSSSAAAATAAAAAPLTTPVKSLPSFSAVHASPFRTSALLSKGSPRKTRLPSPYFARHQQALLTSPARARAATVAAASADSSTAAAGASAAAALSPPVRPVRSPSLPLPFLLLTTHRDNFVHVQQSDDREEVALHVSGGAYDLRDVWQLMRAAGFHHASPWDLPRILGSRQLCKYYPVDAIRQADGDDATARALMMGSPLRTTAQIAADAAQGSTTHTSALFAPPPVQPAAAAAAAPASPSRPPLHPDPAPAPAPAPHAAAASSAHEPSVRVKAPPPPAATSAQAPAAMPAAPPAHSQPQPQPQPALGQQPLD